MKSYIKTVIFQSQVQTLGSYPSKFLCDNGKVYIVKHSENGRVRRELINEWLGTSIAELCGVFVPPSCVVDIMPESVPIDTVFERMRPSGIGFGSELLPLSTNINDVLFRERDFSKFALAEQLIRIIALDIWLHNNDRTINNPNVLVHQEQATMRLYAIDHARIFNGFSYDSLARLEIINESPTLFDTLLLYSTTRKAQKILGLFFEPMLEKIVQVIQAIPEHSIERIFSVLPPEYSINSSEQEIIFQYLIQRQQRLGDFFTDLVREEL